MWSLLLFVMTGLGVAAVDAPACSLTCAKNVGAPSGCNITDIACLCRSAGYIAGLAGCLKDTCAADVYQAAALFAEAQCSAVGVSLTIPGATSSTSSPPPTSTSQRPTSTSPSSTHAPPSSTSSPHSATTPDSTSPPSTNTTTASASHSNAAVIGGAVGGALAALAVLLIGLLFCCRRRRGTSSTQGTTEFHPTFGVVPGQRQGTGESGASFNPFAPSQRDLSPSEDPSLAPYIAQPYVMSPMSQAPVSTGKGAVPFAAPQTPTTPTSTATSGLARRLSTQQMSVVQEMVARGMDGTAVADVVESMLSNSESDHSPPPHPPPHYQDGRTDRRPLLD